MKYLVLLGILLAGCNHPHHQNPFTGICDPGYIKVWPNEDYCQDIRKFQPAPCPWPEKNGKCTPPRRK